MCARAILCDVSLHFNLKFVYVKVIRVHSNFLLLFIAADLVLTVCRCNSNPSAHNTLNTLDVQFCSNLEWFSLFLVLVTQEKSDDVCCWLKSIPRNNMKRRLFRGLLSEVSIRIVLLVVFLYVSTFLCVNGFINPWSSLGLISNNKPHHQSFVFVKSDGAASSFLSWDPVWRNVAV